uniref:transketolase n=1 Tax=Vaucheria litorea TaxID=109269 RepID=H6WB79_VAULI|nr:transketolase [Vaucheria litorea]|mmetsp:Transcript_2858/g.4292  ORF Transcript_2858/g.4292 Transcript_2858/m.4292 type:complete len:725 (+) Transcript_2858:86-2260(+)|eukprot:CAMPEP_0171465576 /NCGR_PEP_ID=MMETSP0945-20130129/8618_1 /TAXON_ID=109269 /ORGANISM="Vaucheria litorea, Strain CCMP2940" /LENGTH=724 /DNA_ID=CAMNT_0011993249 /DNA_START=81 /DNA_END=2255 /DNA_ORIENTATION=+
MRLTSLISISNLVVHQSHAFLNGGAFVGNQIVGRASTSLTRGGRQVLKAVATAPVVTESLTKAAVEARGLAMDSIGYCHSGHLGLPLGCAEIGAVLFGHDSGLTYNPEDPQWINRDRFVLSAGHGSMFLYSWLHLAGYDLPLEEVKNFRRFHSMTPGHPEFPNSEHNTPGVEATTGPLGQGVANAAGMAAAAKMAAARFNTPSHEIFSNTIVALCGDGCIQEGVSSEAACFSAQEGLDNLIVVYDANDVTLDKMAEFTQKEDVAKRYEAYGWDVVTIDGHDLNAVSKALADAKSNKNGNPKLIIAKTVIGKGISAIEGTNAAHGEAGVKYVDESRKELGLPEEKWYVSPETRSFFKEKASSLKDTYNKWQDTYKAWQSANPDLAKLLQSGIDQSTPSAQELLKVIPEFDQTKNIATREAGSVVLQPLADALPLYVSGSADLHGSNKNYIKNGGDFGVNFGKSYTGRNFYYGIREHAMGSILNGINYFGLFRASGATFLVFADYLRATIRVASLAELPVGYIFTHDSIGVGEDGPTHQPVETVSGLRVIPNLDVIRPADPEETAAAYAASIERKEGPTALILTRQNVRTLSEIPVSVRREGTLKGAYVAKKETSDLQLIILASGSEVQWAMDVAKDIPGARVVSMPSMYRFDMQPESYKESVLPAACTKRISIEAGVTPLWWKYVGTAGKVLGTDKFGLSAPGDKVMEVFGMDYKGLKREVEAYM